MTVHFIGAGPGAPDLITLRGRDLIARSPVCLYAGSLVPASAARPCPPGADIVDTAPLDLDAIVELCVEATQAGKDVARLHSGDLSIWSAMGEQLRRLDRAGVPYTVTPGVPGLRRRRRGAEARTDAARSRPIAGADPHLRPRLADAGARDARRLRRDRRDAGDPSLDPRARELVAELTPFYGADCPAAVVARASGRTSGSSGRRSATLSRRCAKAPIERTALILVGPALAAEDFRESALYNADYVRRFRAGSRGEGE